MKRYFLLLTLFIVNEASASAGCGGDPNAISGCGTHCGNTCATFGKGLACPGVCIVNGCDCRPGYVYDPNVKKCVKLDDCTTQCTKPNEHYVSCYVGQCQAKTCDELGKPIACPRVIPPCKDGCICNDGYVRDKDGNCVPIDKCNVCGPNEFNVSCNANCPTDYCPEDDSRAIIACDPPYPCPSGCRCKFNYLRKSTDEDECILASDCPPVNCTRPNEVWDSCPDPCNLDCCEYVDKGPIACNALLRSCQPQCVCQQGYFRNSADECVSADECRAQNCGANERYLSDTTECQLSCFDSRTVAAPPRLCAPSSGCFCNPGYLRANRDGTGDCVARKTCHRTVIGPPPPVPL